MSNPCPLCGVQLPLDAVPERRCPGCGVTVTAGVPPRLSLRTVPLGTRPVAGWSARLAGLTFLVPFVTIGLVFLALVGIEVRERTTARRVLEAGTSEVRAMAFSADGQYLATTEGKQVRVWRTADGVPLHTLPGHAKATGYTGLYNQPLAEVVNGIAFRPDGRLLVTTGYDRAIRLWRLSDGALIDAVPGYQPRERGRERPVFSADGTLLATSTPVRVWAVSNDGAAYLRTCDAERSGYSTQDCEPLGFTDDGAVLHGRTEKGQPIRWRVSDGARLPPDPSDAVHEPQGGSARDPVYAWSADGRYEARDNRDTRKDKSGPAILLDRRRRPFAERVGSLFAPPPPELPATTDVSFAPSEVRPGRRWVENATPARWEPTLEIQFRSTSDGGPVSYEFRLAGQNAWAPAPGGRVTIPALPAGPIALEVRATGDSRDPASAVTKRFAHVLPPTADGWLDVERLHTCATAEAPDALTFSHDGRTLATSAGHRGKGVLRLWDVPTGKQRGGDVAGWGDPQFDLAFRPDGTLLGLDHGEGETRVRPVASEGPWKRFRRATGTDSIEVLNRDGTRAAVFTDTKVTVWDVDRETVLWTYNEGTTSDKKWGTFSPDGRLLAVLSDGYYSRRELRLHEAATGKIVAALQSPGSVGVLANRSLVFSRNGLALLVGCEYTYGNVVPEHGLILWRYQNGAWVWVGPLTGASASSTSLLPIRPCHAAFSPDGRWIALAAHRGVAIHRATDGALVHRIPLDDVTSVAFSPVDGTLAVGNRLKETKPAVAGGNVTLWKIGGLQREPGIRE